jgi:hypothetical protein
MYSASAYLEVYWRGRGAGLSLQLTLFLDFLSYVSVLLLAKMVDVSSGLMLFLTVCTWISVSTTR